MYFIFMILPKVILIPFGIYLYFVLKRMTALVQFKLNKWVMIGLSAAIILWVGSIFKIQFIVFLHIVFLNFIMELLNFLYKRTLNGKEPGKVWNVVYKSLLVPILITAIVLVYGYFNMNDIRRTEYNVQTGKAVSSNGYKIVALSDLHFGNAATPENLRDKIDAINRESADFIILAGDIADEMTTKEGMEKAFKELGKLKSRMGIFYVYGNHDFNDFGRLKFSKDELDKAINKAGIKILADTIAPIGDDLLLIGRKDYVTKDRKESKDLIANTDKEKYLLLVDHQPREIEKNASLGYDLQISGHTHDGQIMPFGYLSKWLGFTENLYGVWEKEGFKSIVTSGIAGWAYPIRTEGHSEYIVINLQKNYLHNI